MIKTFHIHQIRNTIVIAMAPRILQSSMTTLSSINGLNFTLKACGRALLEQWGWWGRWLSCPPHCALIKVRTNCPIPSCPILWHSRHTTLTPHSHHTTPHHTHTHTHTISQHIAFLWSLSLHDLHNLLSPFHLEASDTVLYCTALLHLPSSIHWLSKLSHASSSIFLFESFINLTAYRMTYAVYRSPCIIYRIGIIPYHQYASAHQCCRCWVHRVPCLIAFLLEIKTRFKRQNKVR